MSCDHVEEGAMSCLECYTKETEEAENDERDADIIGLEGQLSGLQATCAKLRASRIEAWEHVEKLAQAYGWTDLRSKATQLLIDARIEEMKNRGEKR